MTPNRYIAAAARISTSLNDYAWQPRRSHLEGARNELSDAGQMLDGLEGHLHLLKAAIKAGDPHDELRFRVEEIERAMRQAHGQSAFGKQEG